MMIDNSAIQFAFNTITFGVPLNKLLKWVKSLWWVFRFEKSQHEEGTTQNGNKFVKKIIREKDKEGKELRKYMLEKKNFSHLIRDYVHI